MQYIQGFSWLSLPEYLVNGKPVPSFPKAVFPLLYTYVARSN